jgi:hypothetical protein
MDEYICVVIHFITKKLNAMNYNTNRLQNAAECDRAITLATDRKNEFVFDQTVAGRGLTDQEKSNALTTADLISTRAQITGMEAAIAQLPNGEAKADLTGKLRRLNDRKDNLEERLQRSGSAALLDTELDAALLTVQVAEIDLFIAAVFARKATL